LQIINYTLKQQYWRPIFRFSWGQCNLSSSTILTSTVLTYM